MSTARPETWEDLRASLAWISDRHALDVGWLDQIADALALPLAENPLLAAWRVVVGAAATRSSMYRLPEVGSEGYGRDLAGFPIRSYVASRYAWAVPDDEALDAIAEAADGRGVIEVGAGLGYWAALLRLRGVDVVATDAEPLTNHWCEPTHGPWADVECRDGIEAAAAHPERLLLMVWPPMADWPGDALDAYRKAGGRTVAYVGEDAGGCTGADNLWRAISLRTWEDDDAVPASFEVAYDAEVPQWSGIHDRLMIAERI